MLQPGTLFAGRYQIINKIGGGAFTSLYDAIDTSVNRQVTIEVTNNGVLEDEVHRWGAFTGAGQNHPPTLQGYGLAEGLPYFVYTPALSPAPVHPQQQPKSTHQAKQKLSQSEHLAANLLGFFIALLIVLVIQRLSSQLRQSSEFATGPEATPTITATNTKNPVPILPTVTPIPTAIPTAQSIQEPAFAPQQFCPPAKDLGSFYPVQGKGQDLFFDSGDGEIHADFWSPTGVIFKPGYVDVSVIIPPHTRVTVFGVAGHAWKYSLGCSDAEVKRQVFAHQARFGKPITTVPLDILPIKYG